MEEDTYIRYPCRADPDAVRRMILQMPDIQDTNLSQEEKIVIEAKDALRQAIRNQDFPVIEKMFEIIKYFEEGEKNNAK